MFLNREKKNTFAVLLRKEHPDEYIFYNGNGAIIFALFVTYIQYTSLLTFASEGSGLLWS